MKNDRFQLLSLPYSLLAAHDFDLTLSDTEQEPHLIEQGDSLFLHQLRRIGGEFQHIVQNVWRLPQLVLVEAKKSARKNAGIRCLLTEGFTLNGKTFVRYGKSNSQAKEGITLFVDKRLFPALFEASQLGLPVSRCVISKYESQRCLTLSACTVADAPLPRIVIVDEYTKVLPRQNIRYVAEEPVEITDRETGEKKTVKTRRVKEGAKDITLSPFDGCGCHCKSLTEAWSRMCGLSYDAVGFQIRLPFLKGYSLEVPFREYYASIGVTEITDVFGKAHKIEDIDCIWNVSMWKGYQQFKNTFGARGWEEYLARLDRYGYRLGLSKYSHHKKDINAKTRLNFQYVQCLDLWNPAYMDWFDKCAANESARPPYDLLDSANWGKLLRLASYTTGLYERIIKGDKFSAMKFLGMVDTVCGESSSRYTEAVMRNSAMLLDPCVKQFLYRNLKKAVTQAKFGKVYADGYYHTVVGDMVGYMQYAAGLEPVGCLAAHEFYCDTIPKGKALSFRSPLVCPSEVNEVRIVENDTVRKWFAGMKDQDVVMLNMYDLSLPQQGGMDCDGDAVFLCCDPLLIDAKIDKTMIIDVEDKAMVCEKPYTPENIVQYELNSRDNRIGEITNVATSILNQYAKQEKWKRINADNVSLLRIYQGKEIDFIKTGLRWSMGRGLRRHLKKLPYFLLYNYPDRLRRYQRIKQRNGEAEEKLPLPAYRSPSPLCELCSYVETWEKKRVLWDRDCLDTRCLVVDRNMDLSDKAIRRGIRRIINQYADDLRARCANGMDADTLAPFYLERLSHIVSDERLLANYVIDVSYSAAPLNKTLAWRLYGDVLLENLKQNSPPSARTRIVEVPYPGGSAHEFLGKYYEMIEGE